MRRPARCAARAAALACGAAVLTGVQAPSAPSAAAAEPVSLTLNYHCVFPLIGAEPVSVKIDTDVPKTVVAGTRLPGFVIDSVSTVSAASTRGLAAVGSRTLAGKALAKASITVPELPGGLPVPVTSTLDETAIPAEGAFSVRARGATVPLTFRKTGRGTVTVGGLVLTLTPALDDGGPSGLGTFESECTQDPDQNNVLATFDIVDSTPPPSPPSSPHHDYTVEGSTAIKAAGGTVPLNGSLGADVDPSTGDVTADLDLAPATGAFQIWGLLPVTADFGFARDGRTTGELTAGALTVTAPLDVRVTSVKAFGLPVGGAEQCRTERSAALTLTSAGPFDPATGGRLTAAGYTLPPLRDCGALTPVLSTFITGPGNTADLTLTPKEED
ncbi:DUF6801 domain-containing protein [Spirillospora sp. NPDC047418]